VIICLVAYLGVKRAASDGKRGLLIDESDDL
jgi:hypothetical protein